MQPAKLDLYNLNTQEYVEAQWSEFKKYLNGTYVSLSFVYDDFGSTDFYLILTEAWGGLHRKIVIAQGGSAGTDFSTNFAPSTPKKPEASLTLEAIAEKTTTVLKKLDLTGSTYNYIGTSELGTTTSAAAWQIKRITFDVNGDPTTIQWAPVNSIWDNRGSLTYS